VKLRFHIAIMLVALSGLFIIAAVLGFAVT